MLLSLQSHLEAPAGLPPLEYQIAEASSFIWHRIGTWSAIDRFHWHNPHQRVEDPEGFSPLEIFPLRLALLDVLPLFQKDLSQFKKGYSGKPKSGPGSPPLPTAPGDKRSGRRFSNAASSVPKHRFAASVIDRSLSCCKIVEVIQRFMARQRRSKTFSIQIKV